MSNTPAERLCSVVYKSVTVAGHENWPSTRTLPPPLGEYVARRCHWTGLPDRQSRNHDSATVGEKILPLTVASLVEGVYLSCKPEDDHSGLQRTTRNNLSRFRRAILPKEPKRTSHGLLYVPRFRAVTRKSTSVIGPTEFPPSFFGIKTNVLGDTTRWKLTAKRNEIVPNSRQKFEDRQHWGFACRRHARQALSF